MPFFFHTWITCLWNHILGLPNNNRVQTRIQNVVEGSQTTWFFLFGPPVSKLLQIVMHGSKNRFMLKRRWRSWRKKNFYTYISDVSIKYFLFSCWYLRIGWILTCENKCENKFSFWQKICKFMFYLFKRASVCKWYDMGKCWWKQDRIKTG